MQQTLSLSTMLGSKDLYYCSGTTYSHKLQSLERCVLKPLKGAHHGTCTNFMRQHPGRRSTIGKIVGLFNKSYIHDLIIENAIAGLSTSRIHPFSRAIIPEIEFMKDPHQEENALLTTSSKTAAVAHAVINSRKIFSPDTTGHGLKSKLYDRP